MQGEVDLDQSASSLTDEKNQLQSEISLLEGQINIEGRQPDVDERLVQLKHRLAEITGMEELIAQEKKSRLQSLLAGIKRQRAFSAVKDIKENLDTLNAGGRGQEGTVTVATGMEGFALLRSKKPLLVLLSEVADELNGMCVKSGAVLLTEDEIGKAQSAQFTNRRLEQLNEGLKKQTGARPKPAATPAATRGGPPGLMPSAVTGAVSGVFAGAQLLGLSLDTINGLSRMLRTDRDLSVFDSGADAVKMLGYILESRGRIQVANSLVTGQALLDEAYVLLEKLGTLQALVQTARASLEQDAGELQDAMLQSLLESADSMLAALNPASQPEAFWNQVKGQALAAAIQGKEHLCIELQAQTVQMSEKKWYRGQRIFATGEVQLAYRLFKADDSLKTSGVILKASRMDAAQISKLDAVEWRSQAGEA